MFRFLLAILTGPQTPEIQILKFSASEKFPTLHCFPSTIFSLLEIHVH